MLVVVPFKRVAKVVYLLLDGLLITGLASGLGDFPTGLTLFELSTSDIRASFSFLIYVRVFKLLLILFLDLSNCLLAMAYFFVGLELGRCLLV